MYPDKVSENFFPKLLKFLTCSWSLLIVGEGQNAGKLMADLKNRLRADVLIDIDEEDLALLKAGAHPKQDEITETNALRNLIHVCTEQEGALDQIKLLLGNE